MLTEIPKHIDPQAAADAEDINVERLNGWWDEAEIPPHAQTLPCDAWVVERLMRTMGYDVTKDLIRHWSDMGVIPQNEHNRLRKYKATDIVALLLAAEARRRWIWGDPRHQHKWNAVETAFFLVLEGEGNPPDPDLWKLDYEGLVASLANHSREPGIVERIAMALRAKLTERGMMGCK